MLLKVMGKDKIMAMYLLNSKQHSPMLQKVQEH